MSIATLQEKFFNKGCGTAILVCLGAVMAAGMVYSGSCNNPSGNQPGQASQSEVAKVNGVSVYAETIDRLALNATEQQRNQFGMMSLPPSMEASILATSVRQAIDQALVVKLAQEQGAKFDDNELIAVSGKMFDENMPMQRAQIIAAGQLKPDSTDQDFEAFVKAQTGKTLAELREESLGKVRDALKDPTERQLLVVSAAGQLLSNSIKNNLKPTDAELMATYATYEYKRILLRKDQGGEDPAARAKKIIDELNAKTITFEQAMDRYSGDLPEPGKKLSQAAPRTASNALVSLQKELEPVKTLTKGQISNPVDSPEGTIIYQLVNTRSDAPKDFEKNKERYREQYVLGESGMRAQRSVEEARKSMKIEWTSKSYQALYDLVQLGSDVTMADAKKREARLLEIVAAAKKSRSEGGMILDSRAAVLAEYAGFEQVWTGANEARRKELRDQRIEVLEALLQITESIESRLELVTLYADKGDAENAFTQLQQAAVANNTPDTVGEAADRNITGRLLMLESKKLLQPGQVEAIKKEQDRWKKDRAQYLKDEADQKKAEAAAKAAADAEAKKAAAEAKKSGAKAPTTTPPTSAGGSFLPTQPQSAPPSGAPKGN